MHLTILGSGTMMPTKKRGPSCYFLEVDKKKILLDCGHTCLAKLVARGIDLHKIDILFISHFHTDHFADALPLVHARFVDNLYHKSQRPRPLTILGPRGLKARWRLLRKVFWPEPHEDYPTKFIEGPTHSNSGGKPLTFGKIKISLFPVRHTTWFKSTGIKISHGKKSFVYTGDMNSKTSRAPLLSAAKNTDLLLIEAATLAPNKTHLTLEEATEIATLARAKKTLLTHIRTENAAKTKSKLKGRQNGQPELSLAEDRATFNIK
ncbi:MAG: ribonuclease Z [Candidatus Gracilibacteria bacterium]|jgi:ribonuclease Z